MLNMPYCGNMKYSPRWPLCPKQVIKRTVDDIVRGLDPKNNGQGQALFELSIEAVATSTHLNPSIKWLQAGLNSLVSKILKHIEQNKSAKL